MQKEGKEGGDNKQRKRNETERLQTCPLFVKPASENAPGSVLPLLVKPERPRDGERETAEKLHQ